MKRYLSFLLVYGLLPLWLAPVWMMFLARGRPDGFLIGIPFVVAFALPFCVATTAVALGTIAVHRSANGTPLRRRLVALAVLIPLTTLVVGPVYYKMAEMKRLEKAQKVEEALVLDFVRKNEAVRKEQGGQVLSLMMNSIVGQDKKPPREYRVYISTPRPMYASVLVNGRMGDQPEITLNCVYFKKPDSVFVHPCK